MAVRKLAPPELQPDSFAFTPENEAFADREIAKAYGRSLKGRRLD